MNYYTVKMRGEARTLYGFGQREFTENQAQKLVHSVPERLKHEVRVYKNSYKYEGTRRTLIDRQLITAI